MTMSSEQIIEWKLDGVLDDLKRIHETMKDRQFAFILGAGASLTSGIPTGQQLAQKWLKDLHLRECLDDQAIDDWVTSCGIGAGRVRMDTAAEHYPHIFERRFDDDREAGYAELEAAMDGRSPSLGYSLLAEIIQHTRHKVVVTTNFDNLVADALAMHAHQSPLVVAHESLAGFVRPQLRRPLVAKIHRDLFLHPINDTEGVSKMNQNWTLALRKLFQYFTPVVVGYGGNDGSLMDMLANLEQGDIAGRMIWCYRAGSPPNAKARAVLSKHRGIQVQILGFDEFMLQLAAKLVKDFDVAAIAERMIKLGQDRAEIYQEQARKLQESLSRGTAIERKTSDVMAQSVRTDTSWLAWQMKAQAEPDIDERDHIYQEGMRRFPGNANLVGSYAIFLADQRKDDDATEAMFKEALKLDPRNAINTGNYAIFLANQRKDYNAAETMHKKSLELDPSHATITGSYANFLANQRKDYDAAEAMYKKALELDPSNPFIPSNYANFLADRRKDYDAADAMYKKALELNPSGVIAIGNYAIFLVEQRKDYATAEEMNKKALELDPSNAKYTGNYAKLLAYQRKDDDAEAMYKKALELDPSNASITENYALFLADWRKNNDAAEAMYEKALELDPGNATIAGSYASFLANQRKDTTAAEAMYKKALELDPSNENNTANYASLLLCKNSVESFRRVPPLIYRVLELSKPYVSQAVAEALLYGALVQELTVDASDASMLPRLKHALRVGYARGLWDFSPMFEALQPRLAAPREVFFRALGKAILDADKVVALDEFPAWRALEPIETFSPFPGQ